MSTDVDELIFRFEDAWHSGERPDIADFVPADSEQQRELLTELVHIDLEYCHKAGEHIRIECWLDRFPALREPDILLKLIEAEVALRMPSGSDARIEDYAQRFPELGERLHDVIGVTAQPGLNADSSVRKPVRVNCPHCHNSISVTAREYQQSVCLSCGSSFDICDSQDASWSQGKLPELGKFRLIGAVGRGAFGTVYKALDTELDRFVAAKIPRSGRFASGEDGERFLREARSAAQLNHPGIVAVYEVGQSDTFPYLVSEFVDGITLADALTARRFPNRESARLISELADALDHAHSRGVIHRDIKPSNVMLSQAAGRDFGTRQSSGDPDTPADTQTDETQTDETQTDDTLLGGILSTSTGGTQAYHPRLMDFGLARRDQEDITVTTDGQVLGTPAYMSPEQARGDAKSTDGRSDIYSLGVILYELLTGELPFRGSVRILMHQVIHDEPPRPRTLNAHVPRDLENICLKSLDKDPRRRYRTAGELADDLRRFLDGNTVRARPVTPPIRVWRWCMRKPAIASVLFLLTLIAIAGPLVAVQSARLLSRANRAEKLRLASQLTTLRTAAAEAVPLILDDLSRQRSEVLPELRNLWNNPELGNREKTRVALAMVGEDREYTDFLMDQMLAVELDEYGMIRQVLDGTRYLDTEQLWQRVDPADRGRMLKMTAALALYDPDNPRWSQVSEAVTNALVHENVLNLGRWRDYFRPVKHHLESSLRKVYQHPAPTTERLVSTDILVDYAADKPVLLVELLATADARQFAAVFDQLERHQPSCIDRLTEALEESRNATRTPPEGDAQDKACANLAIALFRLDQHEPCREMLRLSPDPSIRSFLIHRLTPFGANVDTLFELLAVEQDDSIRRAILMTLGESTDNQWTRAARERATQHLTDLFRNDPDTGIHSSAEWVLRRWGISKQALSQIRSGSIGRSAQPGIPRFVTSEGQIMTVVRGPVDFETGTSDSETGTRHRVHIERSFAIATKVVTSAEFYRFFDDHGDPAIRNLGWIKDYGPDPDCPHIGFAWYLCARYCRWLSEREGFPEDEMLFPPNSVPYGVDPLVLPENYLERTGYRMPTNAEWEYMCRTGTTSIRSFGRSLELLAEYAWYVPNSSMRSWPVGLKKPNDFGLFDTYGNIRESTFNSTRYQFGPDGVAFDVPEKNRSIPNTRTMIVKGGSYNDQPRFISSAVNLGHTVSHGSNLIGLRLVRTLPEDDTFPATQAEVADKESL